LFWDELGCFCEGCCVVWEPQAAARSLPAMSLYGPLTAAYAAKSIFTLCVHESEQMLREV
jgi:hypothetical protein